MTTTSLSDPMVGQVLDGRYEIASRLARGGMATVYLAADLRLTRTVAVKIMHVGLGNDEDFARRLDREARAAARLSHPNVVAVFDQGRDLDRSYIVMEYVPGKTLRRLVSREAPMPALRACELLEPILAALGAAHESGLVHRDIKPENVLLSDRGQIKVADFGLSRAITAHTSTATAGVLIGTVSYLPPELVMNGRADARSDVYSAGVLLYEMLTGRKPHTGDTPIQVAYAHVHHDVPPPSALVPEIPDYLDALVTAATSRNPDLRPVDGHEFGAQLRRVKHALRSGRTSDPRLADELDADPGSVGFDDDTERVLDRSLDSAEQPDQRDGEITEIVRSARVEHTPVRTIDDVRRAIPRPLLSPRSPSTPRTPVSATEHSDPLYGGPGVPSRAELRAVRLAEAQRRRRRRGGVALLLVLLLALGAGVGGWYLTSGRFTTTPDLSGLTETQVMTAADTGDVGVVFDDPQFSETVPAGESIDSDPTVGARITRGGTVHVVMSRGPERYAVPKLAGLSQAGATAALTAVNLEVGSVTQAWSETVPSDTVISAASSVGTLLKRGADVDLTVSKGREPVAVKDQSGKDADDATAAWKKAGLTVSSTTAYSDSVAKGKIISQTPKSGNVYRGDKITLVVSKGPELVVVPNVRAMGVKAATAVMKAKGFAVTTKPVSGINNLGLGYVSYTDPKSGSKARKGATITLYVV